MLIAGTDEAGRGPLAGPVVAATVILGDISIKGLNDSKKLTAKQRENLYDAIMTQAKEVSIAKASVEEIDSINILQASLLAMKRTIIALKHPPHKVYVDGTYCPQIPYPSEAVIKGDSKIPEIMAASIIAKVTRDREMIALNLRYPGYDLAKNKGYGTKAHLNALLTRGVTPIHRKTFGPVRHAAYDLFAESPEPQDKP